MEDELNELEPTVGHEFPPRNPDDQGSFIRSKIQKILLLKTTE